MKAKIFAKLKQEYSSLGLGDEILMSRAESLAATGLVTDDNIDAVVFAQRSDLEGLQSLTDKRVTSALEKERKKNEETRKKEEEAAAKKRAEEEARRKAEEDAKGKGKPAPDDDPRIATLQNQMAELLEASKKSKEEYAATLKSLTEANSALDAKVKTLTEENNQAKAEQAKAARKAMITAKAKELGVPDWRIEEGFTIADDATDEAITETLTKVANNISTNLLPGSRAFQPLGGNEPTKEEIAGFAASLVK